MTIQEILTVISTVITIALSLLIMFNVRTKKVKCIKNNVVASAIITVLMIVLAFVVLFLDGRGGLKEVFCKVVAFAVPVAWFCVVFCYHGYISMKNIAKKNGD